MFPNETEHAQDKDRHASEKLVDVLTLFLRGS